MDYFTSDLHIGHDKEFLWKPRGFSSIEEHDTAVIKNWNDTVWPNDTVYILGDLCLNTQKEHEWNRVFHNLNGHKKFIRGNHDTLSKIIRYQEEYGMTDEGLATLYVYNKKCSFYLCHYPTFVGNYDMKMYWCLSGHTHSKDPFQYGDKCVYNVALDAHNCTPVSIEQIIKDIRKYREKQIFKF